MVKSNLAYWLERDSQLREELTRVTKAGQALALNYRWEQKNGKERAYIELILGKEQRNEQCIRLCYVPVYVQIVRDESEVPQLVQEAARTVKQVLEEIVREENLGGETVERPPLTFHGYYLKGERQEYCFGTIK